MQQTFDLFCPFLTNFDTFGLPSTKPQHPNNQQNKKGLPKLSATPQRFLTPICKQIVMYLFIGYYDFLHS